MLCGNIFGDWTRNRSNVDVTSGCERNEGYEDVVAGIDLKSSVGHVRFLDRGPAIIYLGKDIAYGRMAGSPSDIIEGSQEMRGERMLR
jgi:hypothetical protein